MEAAKRVLFSTDLQPIIAPGGGGGALTYNDSIGMCGP